MSDIDSIKADYKVLTARVDALKVDIDEKHRQNRASIHELRNGQQVLLDALHEWEVKLAFSRGRITGWIAGCSAGAGAVTAIIMHLVDKIK